MTSPKSTLVQISAWTTVLTNDHVRGEKVRNGAGELMQTMKVCWEIWLAWAENDRTGSSFDIQRQNNGHLRTWSGEIPCQSRLAWLDPGCKTKGQVVTSKTLATSKADVLPRSRPRLGHHWCTDEWRRQDPLIGQIGQQLRACKEWSQSLILRWAIWQHKWTQRGHRETGQTAD